VDLKRVLVTGASGFIGSHLTKKLVETGLEIGITKREDSDLHRISDLLSRLHTYEVNLQDSNDVLKVVHDFLPDAIFHLATHYVVDHGPNDIKPMIETNILGAVNLLEAAKHSEVKLFVNTSSCFVYKESKDELKEDSDLSPLNLYALTKMGAEQACTLYANKYDLRAVTFRLFPPYGPADNERRLIPYVVSSFLKGARPRLTTGMQQWDFTYVGDIVDAYLRTLGDWQLPERHEIFNIGSGEAVSVREVVTMIGESIDRKIEPEWGAIPHRRNEVWHICADINKADKLLHWKPRVALREGLNRTIESFRRE
jgi:nucleoside-diphosphate-sugar epimerase